MSVQARSCGVQNQQCWVNSGGLFSLGKRIKPSSWEFGGRKMIRQLTGKVRPWFQSSTVACGWLLEANCGEYETPQFRHGFTRPRMDGITISNRRVSIQRNHSGQASFRKKDKKN
jgi:hypothetical protein